jgi:putative addiction module component (TIGR02574 family)
MGNSPFERSGALTSFLFSPIVTWSSHNKEKEHESMSRTLEELESEAMSLNLEARAQLAEKLILSLDAPTDQENLHLWVAEAERRLKALREGKAKEIPAEEAFRRARAAIS